MNQNEQSLEIGTYPTGVNVIKTEDDKGNSTVIVERGDASARRLTVDFGSGGERYCTLYGSKFTISSGDAIVTQDKEGIVMVQQGVPTDKVVHLESAGVQDIRSILVKESTGEGFYDLLDRVETTQDVYEVLEQFGINMSRSESGVLQHESDYVFMVDNSQAEIYVNIGDKKCIKSEGFTTVQVSKGSVFITTLSEGKQVQVVVRIG